MSEELQAVADAMDSRMIAIEEKQKAVRTIPVRPFERTDEEWLAIAERLENEARMEEARRSARAEKRRSR